MSERISVAALREPDRLHSDDWYWVSPDELNALVEAVEAAHRVAQEREGHELGGESPLYVKLCSLDERLDRFDFGEST